MLSLKTLQDYCIHERVRETREARSQRLFFRTPWFLLLFKTSFAGLKINGLTMGFPFFDPTPMIHLSLSPHQWGYKHASPHPALFMWPVRIELRPSSLCGKHFITWVISLTPSLSFHSVECHQGNYFAWADCSSSPGIWSNHRIPPGCYFEVLMKQCSPLILPYVM